MPKGKGYGRNKKTARKGRKTSAVKPMRQKKGVRPFYQGGYCA